MDAARKRAETLARNKAAANSNAGHPPSPVARNWHQLSSPSTTATPSPIPHSTTPQQPRMPLQPIMVNSSPAYMPLSQTPRAALQPVMGNSSPAYIPLSQLANSTRPQNQGPPRSHPGDDWIAGLSDSQRAALLASLSTPSMAAGDNQNMPHLSSFDDDGPLSDDGPLGQGLGSDHLGPQAGPGTDEIPWSYIPDEGPRDSDDPAPVSSLETTMRTIQPRYQQKRKRRPDTAVEVRGDSSEVEESGEPKKRKQKCRSISAIPANHQKICQLAYDYAKIELTHRMPFPVSAGRQRHSVAGTDQFTELILKSFTDAAFDAELEEAEPSREDIVLIRARVPQFRCGLKGVARKLVPGTYGFISIASLKNPTPELITATLEKNRALVEKLINTYIYTDPDNITPQTMFLNDIFQHVLNDYWFSNERENYSFFFKDMTRIELVTLALIIVAVLRAIQEWSTGRWESRRFSHQNYFKAYTATLNGLKSWMQHSEKQVKEHGAPTNLTVDLQERMLRVARATLYDREEEAPQEGAEDMFSLKAMFALASGAA
ncbi:hypothetical protein B0H12DRAFT_1078496 [Mycena haematopus]|nr:hypothetical protein B0H12DRAFT_1078496 [Mycena haematopus]